MAQEDQKVARVGYVWAGPRGIDNGTLAGFQQGLADLGYVEGKTIIIERPNGSPERLASIIAELAASKVDVLVTPGTPTTLAAQRIASGIREAIAHGFVRGSAQDSGDPWSAVFELI